MKDFLITKQNIDLMRSKGGDHFNIKKLLKNDKLDHSQSVRFGNVFVRYLKDLIVSKGFKLVNEEFIDVYGENSKTKKKVKGKKELDICFIKDDTIFYFECKLNLNLDSEKSKETDHKILKINDYLLKENLENTVFSGLIIGWWEKEKGMKITTKTKNLLFMKDFLEIIDVNTTKEEYYDMMSEFGKNIQ